MSWDKPQGPSWVINNYHVNDPVQGMAANCALIAALSSLAWVQKGLVSQTTGEPTTIPFYNTANSQAQPTTVDWYLCMDASGNLVNAHSIVSNEIWPAIYEKAYGSWKQGSPFISCSNYEEANWGGNPCTVLTHLTNKASITKINATKTASAILTDIKLKCIGTKTRYPMVAWTYPTAPNGVTYDAKISAAHSYSLLGYTGTYIVLRNPVGVTLNPGTLIQDWNGIDVDSGDGVFVVSNTDFQKKFEAYGYVVY